eukprot:GFUD01004288.1.p1 GENE.GFUD01004288.1~~GFUD01004288.1.p1  ORF type:complete len:195 (+),score=77.19 GFUD01004288.1:50-634(+)
MRIMQQQPYQPSLPLCQTQTYLQPGHHQTLSSVIPDTVVTQQWGDQTLHTQYTPDTPDTQYRGSQGRCQSVLSTGHIKYETEDSYNCLPASSCHTRSYAVSGVEGDRLERKRERNRVAANKCRLRKMERISQLDMEVSKLKEENSELVQVRQKLEKDAKELKDRLKKHLDCGCVIAGDSEGAWNCEAERTGFTF